MVAAVARPAVTFSGAIIGERAITGRYKAGFACNYIERMHRLRASRALLLPLLRCPSAVWHTEATCKKLRKIAKLGIDAMGGAQRSIKSRTNNVVAGRTRQREGDPRLFAQPSFAGSCSSFYRRFLIMHEHLDPEYSDHRQQRRKET